MVKIIYHLKSAKRGELLQLLSILGISILAAGAGYTAVSWLSHIENQSHHWFDGVGGNCSFFVG